MNESKIRSKKKHQAREWLVEQFRKKTGLKSITQGRFYWTLCDLQIKRLQGHNEIDQLTHCGLITESQYVGIDKDVNKIRRNAESYSEAHFIHGDMVTNFCSENLKKYPPALVYFDLEKELSAEVVLNCKRLLSQCGPDVMVCVNMMLNVRCKHKHDHQEFLDIFKAHDPDSDYEIMKDIHPYRCEKARANMCMFLIKKKHAVDTPFPNIQFINKNAKRVSPYKNGRIEVTARQTEAVNDLFGHRMTILVAPTGWGKTIVLQCLILLRNKYEKRASLILVSKVNLGKVFNDKRVFHVNDKTYEWDHAHCYSYQDLPPKEFINRLIYSVKQPGEDSPIVAHYRTFIKGLNSLTKDEQREVIKNLDIYLDEAHHCTEDGVNATELGTVLSQLLDFEEPTFGLHQITATYFRSSFTRILAKRHASRFKRHTVLFEEHFRDLGLKSFSINYVFYKKDTPYEHVFENTAAHKSQHQLAVWPHLKTGFRMDENEHQEFERQYKEIFDNNYLDVVSKEGQTKNLELLRKNPHDYNFVSACDTFNEGTDWPPLSVLHILRPISSTLVQEQLFGRLFRFDIHKDSVTIYHYIPLPDANTPIREICSDRLNTTLCTLMAIDMIYPIRMPRFPGMKSAKREDYLSLKELLDGIDYKKLVERMLKAIENWKNKYGVCTEESSKILNKSMAGLARDVYNKCGVEDLNIEDFVLMVQATAWRWSKVNRGENIDISEDLNDFDITTLRTLGFDKIAQRDIPNSLVFGTETGLDFRSFEEVRSLLDGKLKELEELPEDLITKEEKSQLSALKTMVVQKPFIANSIKPDEPLIGDWVTFNLEEKNLVGRLKDKIDGTYIVEHYAGVTYHGNRTLKATKGKITYILYKDMWLDEVSYKMGAFYKKRKPLMSIAPLSFTIPVTEVRKI